jgi:hypothetical protein
MTIEYLVGGLILALFTGLIGSIVGGKNKLTVEEFVKHKESQSPHIDCPVHEARLEDIRISLSKMDDKLDKLIERRLNDH